MTVVQSTMFFSQISEYVIFAEAAAGDAPRGPGDSTGMMFVLMACTAVLFYFMLLRPERKRRADMAAMLDKLKKNDRIVTIGGIYGTIVNIAPGGKDVVVKIDESSNTRIRLQRSAISRVVTDETEKSDTSDES
jgi:preprotein translocase subunit YajC